MALYREYRPKTFEDLLGQDHITSTIKNQIKNKQVGHAYLFSGTRGTGKTSTAKIFSRAVNCLNPQNSSPCNECEICRGIADGSILDVMEMDAASNRGVNDIRELRDKVSYPPSYAKYKVYIIDEVHMLTQEAFNALLKTLEEPPRHLIFILATTEPEKIPQTILSRCQRFDFKRIEKPILKENMATIVEDLGLEVEEEALDVLARNADGGMRDALSLLEKCLSFSDGPLKYEDVIRVLGIVNVDVVFNIIDSLIGEDLDGILLAIDRLIEDGRDVHQFIRDIIYHFRNLMMVKSFGGENPLVQVDAYSMEKYLAQVEKLELDYIVKILDILSKIEERSKQAAEPRILLEMGFIKILRESRLSLEERIKVLEEGRGQLMAQPIKSPSQPARPSQAIEPAGPKDQDQVKARPTRKIDPVSDKDLIKLRKNWSQILDQVKGVQVSTSVLLKNGQITLYDGNFVDIDFDQEFITMKNILAANENNKKIVEGVLSSFLGQPVEVRFGQLKEDIEEGQESDQLIESKVEELFKSIDDSIEIEIKE